PGGLAQIQHHEVRGFFVLGRAQRACDLLGKTDRLSALVSLGHATCLPRADLLNVSSSKVHAAQYVDEPPAAPDRRSIPPVPTAGGLQWLTHWRWAHRSKISTAFVACRCPTVRSCDRQAPVTARAGQ